MDRLAARSRHRSKVVPAGRKKVPSHNERETGGTGWKAADHHPAGLFHPVQARGLLNDPIPSHRALMWPPGRSVAVSILLFVLLWARRAGIELRSGAERPEGIPKRGHQQRHSGGLSAPDEGARYERLLSSNIRGHLRGGDVARFVRNDVGRVTPNALGPLAAPFCRGESCTAGHTALRRTTPP